MMRLPLFQRLLCLDHRRRATCEEALCHQFLRTAVVLFSENRTVFGAPLVAEPGFSTPSGMVGHLPQDTASDAEERLS